MLSDRIRDLCQQAVNEQDPNKLVELTQQIIAAFDEQFGRTTQKLREDDPQPSDPPSS